MFPEGRDFGPGLNWPSQRGIGVGPVGLEPTTRGLKVTRSAIRLYQPERNSTVGVSVRGNVYRADLGRSVRDSVRGRRAIAP